MHLSSLALAAAALATSVLGQEKVEKCGTKPMDAKQSAQYNEISKQAAAAVSESANGDIKVTASHKWINVYAHVVAAGYDYDDGWVTDKMIKDTIFHMNWDWHAANVTFNLVQADWTLAPEWADDQDEYGMKKALRKGTYKDLNLYFLRYLGGGSLGYCYYPVDIKQNPDRMVLDGCSQRSDTVYNPNSDEGPWRDRFDLGRTATHEVGHWMGLKHTFEGYGCNDPVGDGLSDTPAEDGPGWGCPVGRDSCPNQPGLDAIHNFMSYSDDACMNQFSPMQIALMEIYYQVYRAGK